MRIYHNQLGQTLNQTPVNFWLVFGDEPWQKNDAVAQIKQHAQAQGFDELIRINTDDNDWQALEQEYNALSLFAARKVIELDLGSSKVDEQGAKALLRLCEHPQPDVILLLHGNKLDSNTPKKAWFKSLEKQGCYLPIYDLEGNHLQRWVNQQAKQLGLSLSYELPNYLITLFEGNLLALSQELEKLSILFQGQQVSLEMVEPILLKQAKFNPFQLNDALLSNNPSRCLGMLKSLKEEGQAIAQLIWHVNRTLTNLLAMQEAFRQGEAWPTIAKKYRLWKKQEELYQRAVNQITPDNLRLALERISKTDLISKTTTDFDPYILLADICVCLYHGQHLQGLALDYEYN